LVNLCGLLLDEMFITDNQEIMKEIEPLISKMLDMAQNRGSYLWLAETKLLQAKLSLIQMDIRKAKKLMTQAQMIADLHGLKSLAIRISDDHDSLLDQSSLWKELLKKNAPMSERIKLASINSVMDRLQGRLGIGEPEIKDEDPILLLIMSKDGIPHFNLTFKEDWDYDFLFSSFMSAFNSFSSEIFSRSIDRIKIGENTILINPVESFLVCYVMRGQSYPAQKKLSRFTEEIQSNSEIWDALNLSVKTCKMLEMNNPASFGNLVNEVFTKDPNRKT
jgi:hypothetical protein